ncbi:MAG TPA: DUF222 domain-containing protein [Jatrophihabitantaceae bacterium]|nr:DUF222 domain-containing protein [Jatrophihabitantaceae bacterium]
MLLRSGQLPASGGTPATVLLTLTRDQLESGTGLVTTGHGGQLTVNAALRAAGEADVIPIVIATDGILGYGRSRRIATASQRRALAARDSGCCFPGCDHPAGLPRPPPHPVGTGRRPHAIPPPWIDPDQTPIRNTMHNTTLNPVPAA